MNISGIGPSFGGFNYNSIRVNTPSPAQLVSSPEGSVTVKSENSAAERESSRPSQTFTSADYAGQYKAGATYEMKGKDSDIASLDKTEKVGSSQQSQMMNSYRMFANQTNSEAQATGRAVRAAENFNF